MEKSWKISGSAATWTMTVAVTAPDYIDPGEPLPDRPEPLPDFEGLVEHFRTLVEMTEARWQLDQLDQKG